MPEQQPAEYWHKRWEAANERADEFGGQVISQFVRIQRLEAKLAEVRKVLTMSLTDTGDELGVLERPADDSAMLDRALRLIGRLLAIISSEEESRA